MAENRPVIVWFRKDLRIRDNPALVAATRTGAPIVALYVLEDRSKHVRPIGGASRWWLHHSLSSLIRDFRARGVDLVLRRGCSEQIIPVFARDLKASGVFWNRRPEPGAIALDRSVASALEADGIRHGSFNGSLLVEPDRVVTSGGTPYRVFSPFWRRLLELCQPGAEPQIPSMIASLKDVESDRLDDWKLLPRYPDWAAGLRETWKCGEAAARARLEDFVEERLSGYRSDRDRPDLVGTSGLSPHLHWGEIAPATLWRRVAPLMGEPSPTGGAAQGFLRELGWREFNQHLMLHWPGMTKRSWRQEFERFPWRDDPARVRAWQRGLTGYPLVDAGMRELWHTGWMHNRVRMVAGSFLVKDLLVHWRTGESWFWDTLVDADEPNNVGNWQWVAGSGADAAPFFRIFNPVTQGLKFDPGGLYVRRWIPEIAGLPDRWIHTPWRAPAEILAAAGIVPDKSYPWPIIDHAEARRRALDAFKALPRGR